MNIKNYVLMVILFFFTSCFFDNKTNNVNNQDININTNQLQENIENKIWKEFLTWIIEQEEKFEEQKKEEISNIKKTEEQNEIIEEENNVGNQKILDIKFYSQFPTKKYILPFEDFCEEASLLNWMYYLNNKTPNLEEYINDLFILKEIQDKLFWEDWYRNTSIQQTNLVLILFQNQDYLDLYLESENEEKKDEIIWKLLEKNKKLWKVMWKILLEPKLEDLIDAINNNTPVILPVYGKWLSNVYFTPPWPTYHNILLKWYDEKNFIFNEVWTYRWDSYPYSKELIMNNMFDYIPSLYPENYTLWDSKALVLYK